MSTNTQNNTNAGCDSHFFVCAITHFCHAVSFVEVSVQNQTRVRKREEKHHIVYNERTVQRGVKNMRIVRLVSTHAHKRAAYILSSQHSMTVCVASLCPVIVIVEKMFSMSLRFCAQLQRPNVLCFYLHCSFYGLSAYKHTQTSKH